MIINVKSQTELSSFSVVYSGSVLNETVKTYGLSHAIEHLKCKSFIHLYNDFDRYSISWNAYTSETEIVFYITGLDEYVNKYKQEFLDCLLKFEISEEEFETELKVVIQEYKDCFQGQDECLYYNLLREEYGNYGAIGKLKSLKKINHKDVIKYHKKFLSKPSKIINISKFNDFSGYDDFNTEYPSSYVPDVKDKLKLEDKMKFNKSGIIGYVKVDKDFNYISYVLDMLGSSLLSPFFDEIREKRGLTYGVNTGIERISDVQGIVYTSLITTPDNVEEVKEVYKMILSDGDKYLTQERFDIIKDNYLVRQKKNEIERYKKIEKYIIPLDWQVGEIIESLTFEKTKEIFNTYLTYDKWNWKVN